MFKSRRMDGAVAQRIYGSERMGFGPSYLTVDDRGGRRKAITLVDPAAGATVIVVDVDAVAELVEELIR